MKQYLRIYCNFEQNNWITNFFMTKFVYNNVINAFTKMFSFIIVQNFSFRMSFEHTSNFKVKSKFAKKHVNELQNLMKVLKKNLKHVQKQQIRFHDKRHTFKKFKIENYVWLNDKNIKIKKKQKTEMKVFRILQNHQNNKLRK